MTAIYHPFSPLRILSLTHVYAPATAILKPYNLHALHRLGYKTSWRVTEPVETVMIQIPPRRSVYRDLIEYEVGTYTDHTSKPVLWENEWSLIAQKVLNPYITRRNIFTEAQFIIYDNRLGFEGGMGFTALNRVGSFKGPYSPTLE